jgi:hypothetical protein
MIEQNTARTFYKKLLTLYPKTFKERLAESMEQTFNDLCSEKRRTNQGFLRFVIWTFAETVAGIAHEHVLIIQEIYMKALLTNIRSSALFGLLLILPFMIMEVVNRRNFNEGFPFVLFIVMWINLFAISAILLPIVRGQRTGNHDTADPVPAQENTLLTNPRSALILSVVLILAPGILPLLDSIGWLSLDRLFNGPNPEVDYFPGLVIGLGLILFPVAAGIVAGWPIASTLQAGGGLFAHWINLIIVVFILSVFAIGLANTIIDQWPCFIGVPNCD